MFREEAWEKGFYMDNHEKYRCRKCSKEFIIGEKLLEDCSFGFPICPYCGHNNVEWIAGTADAGNEKMQILASDMGCLAIYINK